MFNYFINNNPGTGILLILFGLLIGTTVLTILFWEPVEWLKNRFYAWLNADKEPLITDTVTETGVGIVEPWQITQERDEWDELLRVFDFGGQNNADIS